MTTDISPGRVPDQTATPNRNRASCPQCGSTHGVVRVDHSAGSNGATYDRFFCARCCNSFEVRLPTAPSPGLQAAERSGFPD